jgi:hypothetical protein
MTTNYWIIEAKLTTLGRILARRRKGEQTRITCCGAGPVAAWLLGRLAFRSRPGLDVQQIPRQSYVGGPAVNLQSIRDDQGRMLIMRIYRHVMAVRHEIGERLMADFHPWFSFFGADSHDFFAACVELRAAEAINKTVFLAHIARWKYYRPGEASQDRNVLIVPRRGWHDILARNLQGVVDELRPVTNLAQSISQLAQVAKRLLKALVGSLLPAGHRIGGPPPSRDGRIMTTYALGVDPEKRNDIGFVFHGGIEPERLLLLCRFAGLLPSEAEAEWMERHRVGCLAAPDIAGDSATVTTWTPSGRFRLEKRRFFRSYLSAALRTAFRLRRNSAWFLIEFWDLFVNFLYWKDMFRENRVSLIVHSIPAAENFVPTLAISELGGVSVTLERSILFDYCTYIHNPPAHVNFVTGPYSLTQIPEPFWSRQLLQCGSTNFISPEGIPGLPSLRERGRIVVALFDEMPKDNFIGDSPRVLYQTLIDLLDGDVRFSLLVKSKKTVVLEMMPDVREALDRFSREGRCVIAGWRTTVLSVAAQADIAVSVPSTAVFESIMAGRKTLLFNPMRTGSSLFYSNGGLNRRVFEEPAPLVDALRRFADGTDHGVGDCSDLLGQIDPFADNRGLVRVGEYLNRCLQLFEAGGRSREVIAQATMEYRQAWGAERVLHPDGPWSRWLAGRRSTAG